MTKQKATLLVFSVFASLTAVLQCPTPALAISMAIYNSGVDGTGTALPAPNVLDPHWVYGGTNQVFTAIDPLGGWVANNTSGSNQSGWIGTPSTGTYSFEQRFSIPAGATGLSLSGRWATDDLANLYLNGNEILNARSDGNDTWIAFQDFSVTDSSFFFIGGQNIMTAVINNTGGPGGFQAQFFGSYSMAAAPGPLPILGVGAAFGFSRHLRRRCAGPRPGTKKSPSISH